MKQDPKNTALLVLCFAVLAYAIYSLLNKNKQSAQTTSQTTQNLTTTQQPTTQSSVSKTDTLAALFAVTPQKSTPNLDWITTVSPFLQERLNTIQAGSAQGSRLFGSNKSLI
ncbi:hypothetical protein [Spirosoma sp. 48-14]|uniref:hypothetical protein n=1 Tax=Spirosoma sp. 48-14 TaxID=1895854 RepID=UPI00096157D6|nr:hypothetical protein [Spirosoma sp. 48-14]OJW76289.1 MAG: hypothetical protein BGO59_22485 [Spirosoma sp. 48-14]